MLSDYAMESLTKQSWWKNSV